MKKARYIQAIADLVIVAFAMTLWSGGNTKGAVIFMIGAYVGVLLGMYQESLVWHFKFLRCRVFHREHWERLAYKPGLSLYQCDKCQTFHVKHHGK